VTTVYFHIPNSVDTTAKPVPAQHKREIIVFRGKEDQQKLDRTGKELTEQLNSTGVAGEVVATRRLPSGDLVLTMEDEKARNHWLGNQVWLRTFGEGARVKRREFVVLAHGIRVNQIQDSTKAI
jgi:hypothetical protein